MCGFEGTYLKIKYRGLVKWYDRGLQNLWWEFDSLIPCETSNHYDYWFFVIYANNEPNPVLARDLGDCRAKDVEEMNGHFLMFNKNIISINANPFLHRKNQQQNV